MTFVTPQLYIDDHSDVNEKGPEEPFWSFCYEVCLTLSSV